MIQKCSDVLKEVVGEARDRNANIKIDSHGFDKALELCDAVEDVAKQFDGLSYGVRIDEETYETYVYVECEDIISENLTNPFIKAISLSNNVGFSRNKLNDSFDVVFGCDPVFTV